MFVRDGSFEKNGTINLRLTTPIEVSCERVIKAPTKSPFGYLYRFHLSNTQHQDVLGKLEEVVIDLARRGVIEGRVSIKEPTRDDSLQKVFGSEGGVSWFGYDTDLGDAVKGGVIARIRVNVLTNELAFSLKGAI